MKRFKNKNKSAKANRKIEYFAFMLLTIVSGIRLWFAPKMVHTSIYDKRTSSSLSSSNITVARHPDLYIWFKYPNDGMTTSNIRVTRRQRVEERYKILYERLHVKSLLCRDYDDNTVGNNSLPPCPDSNILLPKGIHEEVPYQRNHDTLLSFWRLPSSPKIKAASIQAVTYWSGEHQQHIPLPYNHTTITTHHTCHSPEKCPIFCPRKDWKNPDKWDSTDFLCKSTDPSVMPPIRPWGGQCSFETTCFTPEAGQLNSSWPWKSQSQRDQFYKPYLNEKEKAQQRHQWDEGKQLRLKNFQYTTRFDSAHCKTKKHAATSIDLPSDIFHDFQHYFFFLPEVKLLFCGIPKVGISEFIKFFRFSYGAKDYLSFSHFKADRHQFLLKNVGLEKAKELLSDPTWTKAVFIRDPAERLLSAYLNKIKGGGYTQKYFHIGQPPYKLNFSEFVDLISVPDTDCSDPRGLKTCTDPHWKPQIMTCGLDYLLPYMDFVGSFDHIAGHTKELLSRIGMWEEFGSKFDPGYGWGGEGYSKGSIPPPNRPANYSNLGFNQQEGNSTGIDHSTGSRNKLDEYYTQEIMEKVKEAYALDYQVWDNLKQRSPDSVASGQDLHIVKESCLPP